jgi:predicted amidohydrolase
MTSVPHSYRIALAQYPIEFHADFDSYANKLERWVAEAAAHGARLLVFPEYGSMELVSLLPANIRDDLQASLEGLAQYWNDFDQLHATLAQRYRVHVLASSFPRNRRNVAAFYSPQGKLGEQEKNIMTRFERETWHIQPGNSIQVFDTELGKIAVAICYDSEFPLLVRKMTDQGANLILVPSCTDSLAGYYRVRIGSQARALENQCYVAQSPTVGEAPWSPATDVNIGAAALYGPPDLGFPPTGVIVEGKLNAPSWVYGEISLHKVSTVRQDGHVLNHLHWKEQL